MKKKIRYNIGKFLRNHFGVQLLIAFILIIGASWIIAHIYVSYKFNPDEDVWTDFTCCSPLVRNSYCDNNFDENRVLSEEEVDCPEDRYGYIIDWRPKNECELDPEAEGCICDEYETDKEDKKQNWLLCQKMLYEGKDINCSQLLTPLKCISSHSPNECELENPSWVWENQTWWDHDGEIYNRTICRKKTIDDYSCEELKKHIILGYNLCVANEYTLLFGFCREGHYYSPSQLYDIAEEKGCKI